MTNVPFAMTWGSPTATKHALLIHGLSSSSHTWHRVATSLATHGYFVTAPNLIGHGSRTLSTDYRVSSIAEDIRPYLESNDYSLIIGHSLGALTTLVLLAHLSPSQLTAILLIDPPLQQSEEQVSFALDAFTRPCANPVQADVYSVQNPLWDREDCTSRELGTRLCSVDTVGSVFEQNKPWDFLDQLATVNATIAESNKWRLTVLLADPARFMICPVGTLRPLPHVRPVIVSGAGHWIQYDFPDVVVEEALKTVAEVEAAA